MVINCKKEPELYVGLRLCSTPCMRDKANVCCYVPTAIAQLFPCCRQLGCCPDQMVGSRRSLGAKVMQPRGLPAVSVSVSIEETSSTHNKYSKLMTCFKQHGKGCASSNTMRSPTLGRRSLQQNVAVCKHGGRTRDGYLNVLAMFKSKTDKGQATV